MGLVDIKFDKRTSSCSLVLRGDIWFEEYFEFEDKAVKGGWFDREELEVHEWIEWDI